VQEAILAELALHGAIIDAVYACAHHPDGKGGYATPITRDASPTLACCYVRQPNCRWISRVPGRR